MDWKEGMSGSCLAYHPSPLGFPPLPVIGETDRLLQQLVRRLLDVHEGAQEQPSGGSPSWLRHAGQGGVRAWLLL